VLETAAVTSRPLAAVPSALLLLEEVLASAETRRRMVEARRQVVLLAGLAVSTSRPAAVLETAAVTSRPLAAVPSALLLEEESVVAATGRPAGCRRVLRIRPPSDGRSPPPIWRSTNPPAEGLRRPGPSPLGGTEAKVRVAGEMAGTRRVTRPLHASDPSQTPAPPEDRGARPSSMWKDLRRDPAGTGDRGSSRQGATWVRRSSEPSRPVGSPLETPSREHPGLERGPGHDHRD